MPIGDEMKILLAELMESWGLSYRQVEIITGISKSTLHNIATGKRMPRMDTMEKLAEHLHVRIEDLYESEYKWKSVHVCGRDGFCGAKCDTI